MEMLNIRLGEQGEQVQKLQQALLEKKFSPGVPDGVFGSGTQQALLAFQESHGLLPDGLAGPRTLKALGLAQDDSLPDATTHLSVQLASDMCPGAPLRNIKANLPVVISSLIGNRLQDRPMVLMAVATIRVETASFLPISEGQSRFNTSPNGHPFDLYDFRQNLGNNGVGDGSMFRGRGFVQLTGRFNYRKFGRMLNPAIDLEAHPELANASNIAADLLSLFLAAHEGAIKEALLHNDFAEARKLVNGGRHGLAEFQQSFLTGDRLMQ